MSGRVPNKVEPRMPRMLPNGKFDFNDPDTNILLRAYWVWMETKYWHCVKDKIDSMMAAIEDPKKAKANSASKPTRPAKKGGENEGQTSTFQKPAEDV